MDTIPSILCNGIISNLGMSPARDGGMQDVLLTAAYAPSELQEGSGLVLTQLPSAEFVKGLTYDFERFALSSRESFLIAVSEAKEFTSLGWPLLKLYYSSFFAAHALMRSRGSGIMKLDRNHVNHLNTIAQAYDSSLPMLAPGMFLFECGDTTGNSGREISMTLKADRRGGGVHEGFWLNFCGFIEREAERSVERGEVDSASLVALASKLGDAIKEGRGVGVWLSAVRNEINYQHKYDLWLPYKRSSEGYKALSRLPQPSLDLASLTVSKQKRPMEAFLIITSYVSSLTFSICESVAAKSTRGSAFGQKWRRLNAIFGV